MMGKCVSIDAPGELFDRVDAQLGPNDNRSEWITDAIERELDRLGATDVVEKDPTKEYQHTSILVDSDVAQRLHRRLPYEHSRTRWIETAVRHKLDDS